MMKNLIKYFLDVVLPFVGFEKKYPTGALTDPRFEIEKQTDYLHEELATAPVPPLLYKTAKPNSFPYPFEDQNQTNECGAHAGSLALGINSEKSGKGFARLSKDFIYRFRTNYPGPGMYLQEIGSIGKNLGSCLFTTLRTSATDDEANARVITDDMRKEGAIYRAKYYLSVGQYNDIDTLANIANIEGRALVLFIYATYREWAQEYPEILDNPSFASAPIRHFVTVLPGQAYIENDVKYLTIQDSAHFGDVVVRRVSESFIRARSMGALYFADLELAPNQGPKPKFVFSRNLSMGMRGVDVSALQQCLAFEGLVPKDACTGYFGAITLAGVKAFQSKYASDILIPNGLTSPTGIVGPATRKVLNQKYGI